MQPVRLCILSCERFEETFENTHWRKTKQMQQMQFCILSGKLFEEAFENTQWGKAKQMFRNNWKMTETPMSIGAVSP